MALGTLALGPALVAAPAYAQQPGPTTTVVAPSQPSPPSTTSGAQIDVIEITGRIDSIEADFFVRSIRSAAEAGSQVLVVQLDSPGTIISAPAMDRLTEAVTASSVPVAVWVGPSGASATGQAVRLVRAAATSGIADGAHIGPLSGPCPECRPADPLLDRTRMSATEAGQRHAVDQVSPTLGDFVVNLDGRTVAGHTLHTAQVVTVNGQPRREPNVAVRFAKVSLLGRMLHATSNPWVAYLLLTLGSLLLVFEFYSVGIGLVGLIGAGAIAIGAYGLGALGATPIGLVLIALAAFGYAVDVQSGVPRAWTVIASLSLACGSWALFSGSRRVPWPAIVLILAGALLLAVRGMATMVRGRFSTPAIARDGLVGEAGRATTAIDPGGIVSIRDSLWRAQRVGRSRIGAGEAIQVVGVDGLVLEVDAADRPATTGGAASGSASA